MQTVTTTESRETESAAGSLTLDQHTKNSSAPRSANEGARPKRNQSLDVLRCVAILLVLGRHLDYYPLWSKIGWIGVDLFFVLSGFLVSGLLFHVCLALRVFTQPLGTYYWTTHTRIDSLFAGVAVGYFYHFKPLWFQKMTGHYALGVAYVCCLPAALLEADSRSMQTIGLTLLYIGFSFLLAWSVVRTPKTRSGVLIARAAGIGFYSYSIHLWHRLIAFVLSARSSFAAFWTYVALAIGIGKLMSKSVEMPALRLREKWKLTA